MTGLPGERNSLVTLPLTLALLLSISGCGGSVKVVDSKEEIYLSGDWNDSDARAVSEEMIPDCLSRPWLVEFRALHAQAKPRVLIGDVVNKTSELVNVRLFLNEMQRVLVNSNQVGFVADEGERKRLMDEVRWQEGMARGGGAATAVEKGVSGADFMLSGEISVLVDVDRKNTIKYYQVDLWLNDLRTWDKVWIGSTKRKHIIQGRRARL